MHARTLLWVLHIHMLKQIYTFAHANAHTRTTQAYGHTHTTAHEQEHPHPNISADAPSQPHRHMPPPLQPSRTCVQLPEFYLRVTGPASSVATVTFHVTSESLQGHARLLQPLECTIDIPISKVHKEGKLDNIGAFFGVAYRHWTTCPYQIPKGANMHNSKFGVAGACG